MKNKIVVYNCKDEIIICHKKVEKKVLKDFFADNNGAGDRRLLDYDRMECNVFVVTNTLRVDECPEYSKDDNKGEKDD